MSIDRDPPLQQSAKSALACWDRQLRVMGGKWVTKEVEVDQRIPGADPLRRRVDEEPRQKVDGIRRSIR